MKRGRKKCEERKEGRKEYEGRMAAVCWRLPGCSVRPLSFRGTIPLQYTYIYLYVCVCIDV